MTIKEIVKQYDKIRRPDLNLIINELKLLDCFSNSKLSIIKDSIITRIENKQYMTKNYILRCDSQFNSNVSIMGVINDGSNLIIRYIDYE